MLSIDKFPGGYVKYSQLKLKVQRSRYTRRSAEVDFSATAPTLALISKPSPWILIGVSPPIFYCCLQYVVQ